VAAAGGEVANAKIYVCLFCVISGRRRYVAGARGDCEC
jgi:hypothetical protein